MQSNRYLEVEKIVDICHYIKKTKIVCKCALQSYRMIYVDSGEACVLLNNSYRVRGGEIIFFEYDKEFEIDIAEKAEILVMEFDCKRKISEICNKVYELTPTQKRCIASITSEAYAVFENVSEEKQIEIKNNAILGGEQLTKSYLEQLLILLLREDDENTLQAQTGEDVVFKKIINYMKLNVAEKMSIDMLCREFGISASTLKNLFRKNARMGAMAYFINLKMERAKEYLREGTYNVSQISQLLGYDTTHYFSYQFKKQSNMTPTEYINSILRQ